MKDLKPGRHQEDRENGIGPDNCLRERNVTGLNEKDDENGMGVLCLEMEDWYREDEHRRMAGAA